MKFCLLLRIYFLYFSYVCYIQFSVPQLYIIKSNNWYFRLCQLFEQLRCPQKRTLYCNTRAWNGMLDKFNIVFFGNVFSSAPALKFPFHPKKNNHTKLSDDLSFSKNDMYTVQHLRNYQRRYTNTSQMHIHAPLLHKKKFRFSSSKSEYHHQNATRK